MPTNRRYRRHERREWSRTHLSLMRDGWYFGWWGIGGEAQEFSLPGVSPKDPNCLNVPLMVEAWHDNPDLRAAVRQSCKPDQTPWIETVLVQH